MHRGLLNTDISSFDMSRYIKQLRSIIYWKRKKGRATVNFSGGVGKTLIGIITIKKMQKKNYTRTAIVVVPTTPLKKQWLTELEKYNINNVQVIVINTALTTKLSCDLLILDEVHLYASKERIKVFNITYKWVLGLTGTYNRTDGKEVLLDRYCPVCCTLDYYKGIELDYIADVKIYNVAVPLSARDKIAITNYSKQFIHAMKYFGSFELMQKCCKTNEAKLYAEVIDKDYREIVKSANYGMLMMRRRKDLLYTSEAKINACKYILNEFKVRTLTFGLITDTCDLITDSFKKESISYHTNLKNEVIKEKKRIYRKTLKGIQTLKLSYKYAKIGEDEKGFYLEYNKDKVLSKEETLNNIITKFKNPLSKLRIINTAKALNQGFSVDELELIIRYASTSSHVDFDQIMWRACRKYKNKIPIMINLYHNGTQDEIWLKKAQKNIKNVRWIDLNNLETIKIENAI